MNRLRPVSSLLRMQRGLASSTVKPGMSDMLRPILQPFSYIRSKMDRIDNARDAYESCSKQFSEENHLLSKYPLKDEFPLWFSVTVLHMWMLNARLRTEGRDGAELKQEIFNILWLDVEIRLNKAGIKTKLGAIVSELMSSYYGQSLAYDEGLSQGDAIFAAALWRYKTTCFLQC
ncbi:ubiquinol-cytochrome C chaperone-domain-containing protein [Chytridium lagenaria]|nr:ubiquinol-cytochrome C chaperone-domain-containing protein [Chytridium lagenaria]